MCAHREGGCDRLACAVLGGDYDCSVARGSAGCFSPGPAGTLRRQQGHPQYDLWLNYALSTNDRRRDLVKNLREFIPSLKGLRVLDIGSGYGGTSIAAALEGAHAVGIELGEAQLRLSAANLSDHSSLSVEIHRIDAMDWSKLEVLGTFDVVTCDNVIEHVPQPELLVAHIRRLLKPKGFAYITAPNAFSLGHVTKDCHYGQFGLSLLDPIDGLTFVRESSAQSSYDVSRYFAFSGYRGLFEKYGLNLRLLNRVESSEVELATLLKQRDALERVRASAKVPAALADKVKVLVDDFLQRFERDIAFLKQLPQGEEKKRFGHELFREYGDELWLLVASPQTKAIGVAAEPAAAVSSAPVFRAEAVPTEDKPSRYPIGSHRTGLIGPAIVTYKRAVQRLVGPLLDSILPQERVQAVRAVRDELIPEMAELRERLRALEQRLSQGDKK